MSHAKGIIRSFLRAHGITREKVIEGIISGYDLYEWVSPVQLEAGETLYQFVRDPTAMSGSVTLGNWFCLRGATMDGVGIFSGLGGRTLKEFEVIANVEALEGTARKMKRNWNWEVGGGGGATQLFIPDHALFSLQCRGTASF